MVNINKINKKIFFSSLFIFVLLLTGCSKNAESKSKEVDVFVGTEGLTAEFSKTAPPQRVFEDSSFPILLRIKNQGTYTIDKTMPGLISFGREKDYIPLLSVERNNRVSANSDNEVVFEVDGKTQISPKGDEIIISLNAKTGNLDPQSEQRQSTITATLCYPYKTVLSTTACIDPDVEGTKPGKKVCTVKDLSFSNGQGAPISITKIEQQMIPDEDEVKPQFLIFIENKGRGNPVDIGSYPNVCGKSDFVLDEEYDKKRAQEIKNLWNVAFLSAYTSGSKEQSQLICCPNIEGKCPEKESSTDKITGFVRFKDKKDFIRCTFREGIKRSEDAFTSPLRIEIDYGYVQTITKSLIIQKPLKY